MDRFHGTDLALVSWARSAQEMGALPLILTARHA